MKLGRDDYNRIQDPAGKIPADEPVFLLRAQDVCAVATVQYWAQLAQACGTDPELVNLACEQAQRMADWPKHKTPDLGR